MANGVLEFFKQRDESSEELIKHGLPHEEVDALEWRWLDLGWAQTQLTERQWEIVAGNQQAPHREPRPDRQRSTIISDPVQIASEMDQVDNLGSITLQSDEDVADAKDRERVGKIVRG